MAEESTQAKGNTYPPPADFASEAHISSMDQYNEMYQRSITDPEGFWADIADDFEWKEKWSKVLDYTFEGNVDVKWFIDGKTNLSVNCLDRHLATRGDQTAIIWEGNDPSEDSKLTYNELYAEVCRFANALKSMGVEKGDRVCLYLHAWPAPVSARCIRLFSVRSVLMHCAIASRTPSARS
jgi:acetyl-CoA synthetase